MAFVIDFTSFFDCSYTEVLFEIAIIATFFVSLVGSRMLKQRRSKTSAEAVKDGFEADKKHAETSTWQSKSHPKHEPDSNRQQEAERTAAQIIALSTDQFTRSLQLYRQMVNKGTDKLIRDQHFYFALIHASVRVGKADVVGQVLSSMKRNGVVCDGSFFQSVLKLFASRRLFPQCRQVCKLFWNDLPAEKTVCSCLAFAAAESNDTDIVEAVLGIIRKAPEEIGGKDCVNLFRVFQKNGDADGAVNLLRELQQLKVPLETVLILNVVLGACVLAGQIDRAREILDEARSGKLGDLKLDSVTFNTLLKGYSATHQREKCLEVLKDMATDGVKPDDITQSILIDGCLGDGEFDLNLASEILSGLSRNAVVHTTIIKRFIKADMLDQAMQIYDIMNATAQTEGGKANCFKPDLITYSILIKGHCGKRQMEVAMKLVEDMLQVGLQPDDLIVTHLLEGCCHVGNVTLGEKIFEDALDYWKVTPSTYTIAAMVKLYGRCGDCAKALALVSSMKQKYNLTPSVIIFTCLMSGFVRNKRYDEAYEVLHQLKSSALKPDEMTYTTAIEACKQAGKLDKVLELLLEASSAKVDLPDALVNVSLSQMLRTSQYNLAQRLFDFMETHKIKCTVPRASQQLKTKCVQAA